MADQIYKVRDPQGNMREISGPAGASDEEIIAQAQKLFSAPKRNIAAEIAADPISQGAQNVINATPAELIAGNPVTRFALGAADPIMGAAQFARNLFSDTANAGISALGGKEKTLGRMDLSQLQGIVNRGREAYGSEGIDAMRTMGNVVSPASLMAMKLAPAATAAGRIGQGAGIGAVAGGAAPVTEEGSYWGPKAAQVGAGAALGGAVTGGIEAARGIYNLGKQALEPAFARGREQILNRYQQALAGNKAQQMAKALRSAPEIVPGSQPTAGEALATIPESTGLAAHQKAISGYVAPEGDSSVSTAFARRLADQQGARTGAIARGAGTEDDMARALATRTENAAEGYGPLMAKQISPESQVGIMQKDIAGRFASRAEALRDKGRFETLASQSANRAQQGKPGWISNADRAAEARAAAADMEGIIQQRVKEESFLKGVMESLRNTVGLGTKSLDDFTSRPSFRAALAEAEMSAREAGRPFPTKATDKFTVEDMQAVKEFLDESIKKKVGLGLTEADRSVRDIAKTRTEFVKWLGEKVPAWSEARLQYSEDSVPINQMQVMRELGKRLTDASGKETPQTFLKALDDRTPEAAARLLKKSTGFSRYENLEQAIGPKNKQAVDAVAQDLERFMQFQRNAAQSNIGGPTSIAVKSEGHLPNILSRPAMITNWVMKKLGEGADEKIVKMAAERYLNPKQLADALEAAKASPQLMRAQKLVNPAIGITAFESARGMQP